MMIEDQTASTGPYRYRLEGIAHASLLAKEIRNYVQKA